MTSGVTFGTIASAVVSAYLLERFGRRKPLMGGCITIIIGAVIQGASVNYGMFVTGRFIIGFGLGVASTAAPPLISECAYPSQRGTVTSFFEPIWGVGAFIASLITYGTFKMSSSTWSWRIPSLLQGFIPLIQIFIVYFAPESPRWLIYQDRFEEAEAIFKKYHSPNNGNMLSSCVLKCMRLR